MLDLSRREFKIMPKLEVVEALPAPTFTEEAPGLYEQITRLEVGLIRAAIAQGKGNVSEAARILKVNRSTLVEKIKKFGITAKQID